MKNNKIVYLIIIIMISLIFLMYLPSNSSTTYQVFRVTVFILGGFAFALSFNLRAIIKNRIIIIFIMVLLYSLFLAIIGLMLNKTVGPFYELSIAFLIIIIGMNISRDQISVLSKIFILLILILGIISTYTYFGGFIIHNQYLSKNKNQLGVLYGTASILCLFFSLQTKNNKWLYLLMFIVFIAIIVVNRNRSILLGIAIVGLFLIFVKGREVLRSRRISIIPLIIIVSFALIMFFGGFDNILSAIYSSVFSNFDINDINSISAGRIDGYKQAISIILEYPMFGVEFRNINIYSIPHNYFLNIILTYGFLGSIPFIILLLSITLYSLKGVTKNYTNKMLPLLFLLMIVVSMLEYSYPYGPGTTQIMLWLIFGNEISSSELNNLNIKKRV